MARARRRTFRAYSAEAARAEQGLALIEVVCALAIVGLLASIIFPGLPRATSRVKLEAYAVEAAAILKGDRNVALRRRVAVATPIDPVERAIRSGSTGRSMRLPRDVIMDAVLASRCGGRSAFSVIEFFPSGMSCGGVIALRRPGVGYEIRVNWLTGGIEIVAAQI